MIITETIIVPLEKLDTTKQVGLPIKADNLPVFGRIFVHEGFKILKVDTDYTGIVKFVTVENMNRQQVSYDVKVVPTGYKIEPLDEYVDTLKLYNKDGDVAGHIFLQHSHPPKRKKL